MNDLISYAQNFEDIMLWRALSHVEHGLYIDIGAQDPVIDSVSLLFHEHGWRGIHVEPTPHYAELLRQQRPGDTVIQAAVGNGDASLQFFEIPGTGISTAIPEIARQHREQGFDVHEITVPSITLSAIFESCGEQEIHWLKIDVEGFERQVLNGWGSCPVRPWIVVVESTLPMTQIDNQRAWKPKLTGYGYSAVYFDGLNRFFVSEAHPELKKAFRVPANIFDGFALSGKASAPFHHLIDARHRDEISEIAAQNQQQELDARSEIERVTTTLATLEKTYAEELHAMAQREQEAAAQLLEAQQRAEQEKTELARIHGEQSAQARQELERAIQALVQREQQAAAQLLEVKERAEQDKAELARIFGEQTAQARQEVESVLQRLAQREQEAAFQLREAQQRAAQEKLELVRIHSEQAQSLQQEHAGRESALIRQLQGAQEQYLLTQQTLTACETDHAAQTNRLRQELETVLRAFQEREHEVDALLLDVQLRAERAIAEQARNFGEQLNKVQTELQGSLRTLVLREQDFSAKLLATQQLAVQERAELARVHSEQINQARHEKESLVRTLEQREQDFSASLLTAPRQTEQETDSLKRIHTEQMHAQQHEHAELEKFLLAKIAHSEQSTFEQSELFERSETEFAGKRELHVDELQRQNCELASLLAILVRKTQSSWHRQPFRLTIHRIALNDERCFRSIASISSETIHHAIRLIRQQHSTKAARANTSCKMPANSRDHCDIRDFDHLDPHAFVRKAYLAILKREPDPGGAKSYLDLMKKGASKREVLTQILNSPEAGKCQTVISGLSTSPSRQGGRNLIKYQSDFQPNRDGKYDLNEFLGYYDRTFVRAAYLAILRREPDSEGMRFYLERVRNGISKGRILAQILKSPEAQGQDTVVSGLSAYVFFERLYALPLLGTLLHSIAFIFNIRSHLKDLRALENHIVRMAEETQAVSQENIDSMLAEIKNVKINP